MASVAQRGNFKIVAVSALLVAAITTGAIAGYHVSAPPGVIVPGVHVAGALVGGLGPDEAEARLARHVQAMMERPILFYLGAESWSENPKDVGIRPADLKGAIARAYAVGRTGSVVQRIRDRFVAARNGYEIPLEASVEPAAFAAWFETMKSRVERSPKDATFQIGNGGKIDVVPSQPGFRLEIAGLAERAARAALDPHARAVGLTVAHIPPAIDTAGAQALGIRRQIASYTTRFDPTETNRTANIRIAADALDGLVLAPGDRFSFNRHVGPRVAAAGYKEAPVIIDGELIPDIGGGVCQVSTTLYATVLLAGLKVTTRVPHSIPATYVPLGLDATVAYDYIDFRFQNDTDGHVLVKAWVDGDLLTVAFYGDEPRYEAARLETELVQVTPRKVIRERRPELPTGEERIIKHGRDGYRVNVWRVARAADGRELRELVSSSVYPSREGLVWIGG